MNGAKMNKRKLFGLQVNKADAPPDAERFLVNTKVAKGAIRRETRAGKEHFVVSSKTMPFGVVMNGGLYTREQIEANYKKLEGTFAPLGHPVVDGQHVSAFSPAGINLSHVGAHNENVRIEGNRVAVDKWIDIEVASRTEKGRLLINRLEQLEKGEGQPIHTSVAVWAKREPAPEGAKGYSWVANIQDVDHDAILLDEPGAATPEQGVGLAVNADEAATVQPAAITGLSYRMRKRMLQKAVSEKFASGNDEYAWIEDFTDSQVVVSHNRGESVVYEYSLDNGKITIADSGDAVQRQETWVQAITNAAKRFFKPAQAEQEPVANKEAVMPLTPEDLAAIKGGIDEALKPVTQRMEALEANQKVLQANADAEEDDMRKAVAEKYGKAVADSLKGEALKELHKTVGKAAKITPNSADTGKTDAPDFSQVAE